MNKNMSLFVRQKGRQPGNNMMPIALNGSGGSRAERRALARIQKRRSRGADLTEKKEER